MSRPVSIADRLAIATKVLAESNRVRTVLGEAPPRPNVTEVSERAPRLRPVDKAVGERTITPEARERYWPAGSLEDLVNRLLGTRPVEILDLFTEGEGEIDFSEPEPVPDVAGYGTEAPDSAWWED